MGRLSKRTIQCRAARQQRLLKQQAAKLGAASTRSGSAGGAPPPPARGARGAPSLALLRKLGTASLQRYQQAHNIGLEGEAASREELVWAIAHHFSTQQVVDEAAVLLSFVEALRRDSSSEGSC